MISSNVMENGREIGGIVRRHRLASDESVNKYKEQEELRDQWKSDADAAKEIIANLDQNYLNHEDDIFPIRYGHLKTMIKRAVNENDILKHTSHAREADRQRTKYKEKHNDDSSSDFLKKGLKGSAQMFAFGCDKTDDAEKYKELTEEDVEEDMKVFNQEVLQYKNEYRRIRDNIDKLKLEYESSKSLIPSDRYEEMKRMIKISCGYQEVEEDEEQNSV